MPRCLRPSLSAAALAVVALVPALTPVVAPPVVIARTASVTTGSLSVSPGSYVAGQAVRFRGNIGAPGVRSVHLESHMNRPGDTWGDVPDSTFSTDSNGDFDFRFRAPAMYNMSYRVAGDGLATDGYLFTTSPQDLTIAPVHADPDYPFHRVAAGATFRVEVDTTPDLRSHFGTPPAVPGRTVLLQEQSGPSRWRTIDTSTTDLDGNAYFSVTAPDSGVRVLRARQGPWTVDGNEIGWYASFPAYFVVSGFRTVEEPPTTAVPAAHTARSAPSPTAAQRFGWRAKRYDYAWEAGQSLDSPPSKGFLTRGRWRTTSTGTGRATPFNGGLVLQSKFKRVGPGDRGTTTATLHRGARKRGRWEFRLQGRPWETGARPYQFRLELVPARSSVADCSPQSVVLADFDLGLPGMRFGVQSADVGASWRGTLPGVELAEEPFTVGVEIGRDHITWFRDGTPIGTVQDDRARFGTRLVPRLSLIGTEAEMNGAQVNSDWQRSWSLRAGSQVTSGAPLTETGFSGC